MNEILNQRRAAETRVGTTSNTRSTTTREDLLRAARDCVRDRGLAGASSREIVSAAGANLGAITYHFGSKDDLLAEALFGEIERRVTPALAVLDHDGEPAELMLEAVRRLLEEFERSKRDTLVYLEALLLATRDARYRRSALALYRSIRTKLAELITELTDRGTVPAWVDADAMSSLILSVANGIALQTRLDPTGADHTAMAGQFALLLLNASSG